MVYLTVLIIMTQVRLGETPLVYRTNDFYQWKGGDTYLKLKERQNEYETLVLGSSIAYKGVNCELLSEDLGASLNLGTSAQDLCSSLALLKSSSHKPNKLVLCVDASSFESDGLESTITLLSNGAGLGFFRLTDWLRDPRLLNSFLVSNFVGDQSFYSKEGNLKCGSVLIDSTLSQPISSLKELKQFRPNSSQLPCLNEIQSFCTLQKIDLSICLMPTLANAKARQVEFSELIRNNTKPKEIIDFRGLFDSMPKEDYFYDRTHLNRNGANLLTERLIERISRER